MKQQNKIFFSTIMQRLSQQVGFEVRPNRLAVLIHGWMKKHPEQAPSYNTLFARKKKDGQPWLSRQETDNLARYAGYQI